MILESLNLNQTCIGCLESICQQLGHESCASNSIARVAIYSVLGTVICITIIVLLVCYVIIQRSDKSARSEREDTIVRLIDPLEKVRGEKLAKAAKQQQRPPPPPPPPRPLSPLPSFVHDKPNMKYRIVRSAPPPPNLTLFKTNKSEKTTTTGDIAFIAPKDSDPGDSLDELDDEPLTQAESVGPSIPQRPPRKKKVIKMSTRPSPRSPMNRTR